MNNYTFFVCATFSIPSLLSMEHKQTCQKWGSISFKSLASKAKVEAQENPTEALFKFRFLLQQRQHYQKVYALLAPKNEEDCVTDFENRDAFNIKNLELQAHGKLCHIIL